MRHPNQNFIQLLARRKMSISQLADQIFSGRSHLGLVLSGHRVGTVTWRKLKSVLTSEEFECARGFASDPGNAAILARRETLAGASKGKEAHGLGPGTGLATGPGTGEGARIGPGALICAETSR
jgi:hypothetical protein